MYITIPVLISRHFDEVEAKEAGVPEGKERSAEEIEVGLEKLLAPYDYGASLNIDRGRGPRPRPVEQTVPNYGARFDFWDVDDYFSSNLQDRLAGIEAECFIYPQEGSAGFEVISAADLPLDEVYEALVTPDGRYHELWLSEEPPQELGARRERIIREHSGCLTVVCKAHV